LFRGQTGIGRRKKAWKGNAFFWARKCLSERHAEGSCRAKLSHHSAKLNKYLGGRVARDLEEEGKEQG